MFKYASKKCIANNFVAELLQDDVVHYQFKDNCVVKFQDIYEAMEIDQQLSNSHPLKRIIEPGYHTTITSPARRLLEKQSGKAHCEAYVLKTPAQKILFHFYKKWRKSNYPIRSFESVDEAFKWISETDLKSCLS